MNNSRTLLRTLVASIALASGVALHAQDSSAQQPAASQDADNTRINQRDRNDTVKPTDQPNDKADIQTAAAVRAPARA